MNDRHSGERQFDCFENFPYKTYEEILAAKRRRLRRRKSVIVCVGLFFVMSLVVINIGLKVSGQSLLFFGSTEPVSSTQVNSFSALLGRGDSSGGNGAEGSAQFNLPVSDPSSRTEAIYVKDVSAMVKAVRQAVVGITCEIYSNFTQSSSGSGIIMSDNGYIVTNNHVISGGDSISVTLDSGESYQAYVIGTDVLTDLAVLKIEAEGLSVAEFGDSDLVEAGQAAVAIGNPTGQLQGSVTAGIISAVNRNVALNNTVMNLIQTDAAINSGNSGGPLLNQYGQVIGVNSVKLGTSMGYEGISFAIPINTVRPIVEQLVAKGYVAGRPLLGVSCVEISNMASAFYSIPQGLLINQIAAQSTLADAGLAAGDIIIHVDGQRVTSLSDACTIRNQFSVGDTLDISVYRKGKQYNLSITLMEQTVDTADFNY